MKSQWPTLRRNQSGANVQSISRRMPATLAWFHRWPRRGLMQARSRRRAISRSECTFAPPGVDQERAYCSLGRALPDAPGCRLYALVRTARAATRTGPHQRLLGRVYVACPVPREYAHQWSPVPTRRRRRSSSQSFCRSAWSGRYPRPGRRAGRPGRTRRGGGPGNPRRSGKFGRIWRLGSRRRSVWPFRPILCRVVVGPTGLSADAIVYGASAYPSATVAKPCCHLVSLPLQ